MQEGQGLTQPKVVLVILTYKNWQDTLGCVAAAQASSYGNQSILLLDNASPNETEVELRRAFPKLEFIQTGQNLGYAGGNNVGITRAKELQADYVLILNNDCIVAPNCVEQLVAAAEASPKIGMVSPKVYEHDRVISHAGSDFSWGTRYYTASRGAGEEDHGQFDQSSEIETATGDCLLVRMSLIATIGQIEPSYFLYYEDTDWCYRARQQGWTLVYQPQATAIHPGSLSTGGVNRPLGAYYVLRNKFLFTWKFAPWSTKVRAGVHLGLSMIKNSAYYVSPSHRAVARSRLWALLDAARNQSGATYRP